jgi:L-amino acid N-acyltransferase YncA
MTPKTYPHTLLVNGEQVVVRLMTADDRAAMLAFAHSLTEEDLLVLRDDITSDAAIDQWISDLAHERVITLLLESKGMIAGYGRLASNQLSWTRHMAEMSILVSTANRNRGYGKLLAHELLLAAQDLKLDKLVIYVMAEQQGARRMFERQGFRPEALLTDWVKTRDGRLHDLVILSRLLGH